MAYKPEGSPSVSPYLVVDDAQAALDFIRVVFGVEPSLVVRDGDRIHHAEARIEDSVVMLGQMPGGPDANVHVYVPDAEAAFTRAIEAGGEAVQPVERKEEGTRRGGVRDPTGTVWWFSTTP
jgi:uncharacterized glyoxalase superfamily protein PhnB